MENVNNINWYLLCSTLQYYQNFGYKMKNLDWLVNADVACFTKPVEKRLFYINEKTLVGSGEQSFLQLIDDNKLEPGRYCGITPCFRDEIVDDLHHIYFMKIELINTIDVNLDSLNNMIDDAKTFFKKWFPVEVIETGLNAFDIIDSKNKIELGSYGMRKFNNTRYLYGTGLAEPRFSYVLNKNLQ